MAEPVKMVVVDGVRYRPEDAPKTAKKVDDGAETKRRTPRNKARTPVDK